MSSKYNAAKVIDRAIAFVITADFLFGCSGPLSTGVVGLTDMHAPIEFI